MEVKFAVHLAPFVRSDQPLVAEAHRMQVTVEIGPPEIIVGKLREKPDFAYGWNAQTGDYGDLFAQGVIDPAKVVRTALQDAASVAGLLITTEAMIAEKPKKEAAPATPAGGMDF